MTNEILNKAILLYDVYTMAVGGLAYDGKPLPSGEEFFEDPTKKKQQLGWLAVAAVAMEDDEEDE